MAETKMAENRLNLTENLQNMEKKGNAGHALFLHFYAFKLFSAKLSISFLPSHPILFCQGPPAPLPRNAYANNCPMDFTLCTVSARCKHSLVPCGAGVHISSLPPNIERNFILGKNYISSYLSSINSLF